MLPVGDMNPLPVMPIAPVFPIPDCPNPLPIEPNVPLVPLNVEQLAELNVEPADPNVDCVDDVNVLTGLF